MNERLKELLEQATTSIKDEYGHWIGSELDEEKFAELIVKECIGLCDQAVEENKRTFYTVNETQEVGPALVAKGCQVQAEKLSKQIKQHFGVEQ
jgi:hypothetical protein